MQDKAVLLFSNHGSPRLYPFHQVGGNGGRGQLKDIRLVQAYRAPIPYYSNLRPPVGPIVLNLSTPVIYFQ